MHRLNASKPEIRSRAAALLATFIASAWPAAAEVPPSADPAIDHCIDSMAREQDQRIYDALSQVEGTGRRLLALRSYLRSSAHLAERWSWTQQQIDSYLESPEHRTLEQEIERVREAFARDNDGFELWVNPQVRSLDVQVASWNSNESVRAAGDDLLAALNTGLPPATRQAGQATQPCAALAQRLVTHTPVPTPTVAAPGLSPHGQMRAVDFQVHRNGEVVAGPRTASIATDWDQPGWTTRLDQAVRAGSSHLVGPLAMPREPWHYTYTPDAVVAR
jgi:hypothetical protein